MRLSRVRASHVSARVQKSPSGGPDQCEPTLTISATMMRIAIASVRENPVSRILNPATAVATKANKRLRTLWNQTDPLPANWIDLGCLVSHD
jgi:sugar/nucleoside kinase (ribokinase family)